MKIDYDFASAPHLRARQSSTDDDIPWWYSDEGRVVKWSVFLGLVLLLAGYIIIGYIHARSRMKKGLMPLGYHRWLVRRSDLARIDPSYAYPANPHAPAAPYWQNGRGANQGWATHRPADAYHMQDMGMPPPPVYDPTSQRPPVYSPPEGGSKVNPTQGWGAAPGGSSEEYAPPSGPPPPQQSGVAPQNTGNTNPFR